MNEQAPENQPPSSLPNGSESVKGESVIGECGKTEPRDSIRMYAALLAISFLFYFLFTIVSINIFEFYNLEYVQLMILALVSLVSFYFAVGSSPIHWRIPVSFVLLLGLIATQTEIWRTLFESILSLPSMPPLLPIFFFNILTTQLSLWIVLQTPWWALKGIWGWRVVNVKNPKPYPNDANQFGMKFLLFWIVIGSLLIIVIQYYVDLIGSAMILTDKHDDSLDIYKNLDFYFHRIKMGSMIGAIATPFSIPVFLCSLEKQELPRLHVFSATVCSGCGHLPSAINYLKRDQPFK